MLGGADPLESFSGYEPKKLFRATPSGRFEERAYVEGWDSRLDGRSLVTSDLDGDGDLDLVMYTRNGARLQLWENVAQNGHSLELELVSTKGHREADGSEVRVDGVAFPVLLARGYASAVDPAVHVGLGERTSGHVVVRWRSGAEEDFGVVPSGARWQLVEGKGMATQVRRFGAPRVATAPPWPQTLRELGLGPSEKPGPTVVQLFMQSCKPCREEVPKLKALAQRGVRVVSLGLHTAEELPRVKQALGLQWETRVLEPEVAEAFEGPQGLILPTVLVYDASGHLVRVISGAGTVEPVLGELR
jgi:thiol-disulfide isomerase/thioredoxin